MAAPVSGRLGLETYTTSGDITVALATAIGEPVYACDGDVRPTLGLGYGWWWGNTIEALPDSGGRWSQVSGIPDPPEELS